MFSDINIVFFEWNLTVVKFPNILVTAFVPVELH
jgi:hypothetical protein